MTLTARTLRSIVHYDPETGIFTWMARPVKDSAPRTGRAWNAKFAGREAGALKPSGYVRISIFGDGYRAHRLAWLYMTGEWPPDQVDHINTNRSDNRWQNLRLATNAQNGANSRKPKNNKSGFKGVFWNKQREKWAAKINPNRTQVHLGFFTDPKKAHQAYVAAAARYFGEFSRGE